MPFIDEPVVNDPVAPSHLASGQMPVPPSIAQGMRWTLWLSLVALPFSYGTNILLARIGPAALGTFGLLSVYIGIVSVFFFWGGCAVPMKFLPEVDTSRRGSFIVSYGIVILISFLPWLLLALWWPPVLHFMFGDAGNPRLQAQLIFLSPLCLMYLLMITSLKALLQMKWALMLDRGLNVGQMLVLLLLSIWNHEWLKSHAAQAVWLTYLALTSVVGACALLRLISLGLLAGRPRFWLPSNFWVFTLLLQGNSILGLLGSRFDYILILNLGGLTVLGQYVAIMSMVGIITRISGFVVDSLLPSVTNCLAAGDEQSTARVAEMHLRLLYPSALAMSLAIAVFVRPVLAVMGQQYVEFASLVQVAALGALVQSLSAYSSTIFTATDRVQDGIIATVARTLTFAGLFWPLWSCMELMGVVTSWVIGEVTYHLVSLYLLMRNNRVRVPLIQNYFGLTVVAPIAVLLAGCGERGDYSPGVALLVLSMIVFLLAARYSFKEIFTMIELVGRVRPSLAVARS